MKLRFAIATVLPMLAASALFALAGCGQPAKEAENGQAKPKDSTVAEKGASPEQPVKVDMAKASYCVGVRLAQSIAQQGVDVNTDALVAGIKQWKADLKPLMTESELQEAEKTLNDVMAKRAANGKPPVPPKLTPTTGTAPTSCKSLKDKAGYLIGARMGQQFKKGNLAFEVTQIEKGLNDTIDGKPQMTDSEINETLKALQKQQEAIGSKAAAGNLRTGQDFVAANGKKPGVVTLPSGLQYKILRAGSGKKPTDSDSVVCDYRGTLIDGTEFDSSYKRGEPATFQVGGVIPGWTEALKLMPVGSKWQLFVPSNLAYGERGNQGIPPNSTLIFEVELKAIK